MKKIISFAHMMKTAGTSFSKMLIGHFGSRMHIVPGGLKLQNKPYDAEKLKRDIDKYNNRLEVISGHPMRPFVDYGELEDRMIWITFLRDPYKRFVSHYLHEVNWSSGFGKRPDRWSFHEWEQSRGTANYQVRFLAGEPNVQKAIDILHEKMKVVGVTEHFKESLYLLKSELSLNRFYLDLGRSNASLSSKSRRSELMEKEHDFILEKNELDKALYDYAIEHIWPEQLSKVPAECDASGKSQLVRDVNMMRFQLKRQLSYRTSKINIGNIKRFYMRWYR